MSVKSNRLSNSAAIAAAVAGAKFDLPESNWALGFTMVFDGTVTGNTEQFVISNGGAYQLIYRGGGFPDPNSFIFKTPSGDFSAVHGTDEKPWNSGAWQFVLQKVGETASFIACPVLIAAPTDTSSVASAVVKNLYGSILGSAPFAICGPSNYDQSGAIGYFCDQSIARVFLIDEALTLAEIAQLAHGKTILQLGKTPKCYLPLDSIDDLSDLGSGNSTFALHGDMANGTAPGWGFGAAITAPVFDTQPVITGTPRVSQTASYIPGKITTNEDPAISQQWFRDGVPIQGAIGVTYVYVPDDLGKTLTVREKAVNSASPNGVFSTSAGVTVLAAPGATTRSVTIEVALDAETLAANLTGLSAKFSTGTGPHAAGTTLYSSGTETTDADGLLSFNFDTNLILAGQSGLLELLHQSGLHFIGLVPVL